MKKANATISDLTGAHLNALNKTLECVEVQVAAVKSVIRLLKGNTATAADADESDETDEDETPPTKKAPGKKAKPAPVDEEEDENEEESDEEESSEEDEESGDEEEDEEEPAPKAVKKGDVQKALKAHAAENTRAKTMKILRKYGVESVHELPAKKYGAIMKDLT